MAEFRMRIDPRFSTRVISGYPHTGWQITNLNVQPNQRLTINAQGTCCWVPGSCAGPDGHGPVAPDSSYLAPGLKAMSLVGKIGNGAPFDVGSCLHLTCHDSGCLYLGYNDSRCDDNSGHYDVTILVDE